MLSCMKHYFRLVKLSIVVANRHLAKFLSTGIFEATMTFNKSNGFFINPLRLSKQKETKHREKSVYREVILFPFILFLENKFEKKTIQTLNYFLNTKIIHRNFAGDQKKKISKIFLENFNNIIFISFFLLLFSLFFLFIFTLAFGNISLDVITISLFYFLQRNSNKTETQTRKKEKKFLTHIHMHTGDT